MEISQPASAGDSRYRKLISIESITIRHSAARSAGCELPGYQPGVPLRSTPGFMLPPASQVGCISSSDFRDTTLSSNLQFSFCNLQFSISGFTRDCILPRHVGLDPVPEVHLLR